MQQIGLNKAEASYLAMSDRSLKPSDTLKLNTIFSNIFLSQEILKVAKLTDFVRSDGVFRNPFEGLNLVDAVTKYLQKNLPYMANCVESTQNRIPENLVGLALNLNISKDGIDLKFPVEILDPSLPIAGDSVVRSKNVKILNRYFRILQKQAFSENIPVSIQIRSSIENALQNNPLIKGGVIQYHLLIAPGVRRSLSDPTDRYAIIDSNLIAPGNGILLSQLNELKKFDLIASNVSNIGEILNNLIEKNPPAFAALLYLDELAIILRQITRLMINGDIESYILSVKGT